MLLGMECGRMDVQTCRIVLEGRGESKGCV